MVPLGAVSGPSASLPGNPKALWRQHLPDSSSASFALDEKHLHRGEKSPVFFFFFNLPAKYFVFLFSIFVAPTTIFLFLKNTLVETNLQNHSKSLKFTSNNAQDVLISLSRSDCRVEITGLGKERKTVCGKGGVFSWYVELIVLMNKEFLQVKIGDLYM